MDLLSHALVFTKHFFPLFHSPTPAGSGDASTAEQPHVSWETESALPKAEFSKYIIIRTHGGRTGTARGVWCSLQPPELTGDGVRGVGWRKRLMSRAGDRNAGVVVLLQGGIRPAFWLSYCVLMAGRALKKEQEDGGNTNRLSSKSLLLSKQL